MQKININSFPNKSKADLDKFKKIVAVATISSGLALSPYSNIHGHTNQAQAAANMEEFNFIEKEATALDPSIYNSLNILKDQPSYVNSSFNSEITKSSKNVDTAMDKPLVDKDDKSFLKLSNNDYLHYISANGDNVVVHYVDNNKKILAFDEKDLEEANEESSSNNSGSTHYTHSGFFIYPYLLGGGGYSSPNYGSRMHSPVVSGGNYSTKMSPKSLSNYKSTTSSVSKGSNAGISSSSIKSGAVSSKGLGSSMSSTSRGGFGG